MRCLLDDRDSLTVYLRFPREQLDPRAPLQLHRTHLRRDAPPGQGDRPAAGEHSCLSLVWAVLDRASAGWRGFAMTSAGLRLLQDLRRSMHDPPNPTAATEFGTTHRNRHGTNRFHSHRVASQMQASGTDIRHFYTAPGRTGVRLVWSRSVQPQAPRAPWSGCSAAAQTRSHHSLRHVQVV